MGELVLLPQQLQRHAEALELLVDLRLLGRQVADAACHGRGVQPDVQGIVVQFAGLRTGQVGSACAADDVAQFFLTPAARAASRWFKPASCRN